MTVMPANRRFSLDAKFDRVIKSETCPRICHKFFVVQVALVYIVASLNKIYPGWLDAEPIAIWFGSKRNMPVIGKFLQPVWVHFVIAFGGILYDGLIAPILLFRQTRKIGLFLSIGFNLFNSVVFQIGIFPYLMIAFSLFFYNPEQIGKFFFRNRIPAKEVIYQGAPPVKQLIYFAFIALMTFQVFLSVRHHLFTGNVHWTEEGHKMAWQMMLRSKVGYGSFVIVNNETKETARINPRKRLTRKQANKLVHQPDMIWQYCRRLQREYQQKGWNDISIFFEGKVKLNKREYSVLVDDKTDLLSVPWEYFSHADWILPYPPERN